jgi:hypothetical protein
MVILRFIGTFCRNRDALPQLVKSSPGHISDLTLRNGSRVSAKFRCIPRRLVV